MFGFLLQWPTFITLVMFPSPAAVYVRLAHREELEAAKEFGDVWTRYAAVTPRWFPRLARRPMAQPQAGTAGSAPNLATQARVALLRAPHERGGHQ